MTGIPSATGGAPTPYDGAFYDDQVSGSERSARVILPLVFERLAPRSVVDIGCGQGAWLAVAASLGATALTGLDGAWVDPARLRHPAIRFTPADLASAIPDTGRHDLCISVEVAEHLPGAGAEAFVDALCAASDVVLFSAAVPHQGGTAHVNEQRASYWAAKFAVRGYECLDLIRGAVWTDERVEWWYRQNCLVFAKRGTAAARLREAPEPSRPLDLVHPEAFESKMAYLLPPTSARGRAPMASMLRAVLAVIGGVIAAMIVITMVERIGHGIYPPPAGFPDGDSTREYIATMPAGGALLVLAGWLMGTYIGGIVAASIARRPDPRPFTFTVSGVILASVLVMAYLFPVPIWMLIAALVGIPAVAMLAARTTARGFARAADRASARAPS